MIIVCEPIVSEQEHVPVNTAFVAAIRLAFPDRKMRFLAEEEHLRHVENQLATLDLPPIDYSPIAVPRRHSGLRKRMWQDFRMVRKISRTAQEQQDAQVIFLSANKNHLLALAAHSRSKYGVHVILHGGLAEIAEQRRNPFARALNLRHFLKAAVRAGIQLIVLESWILRNLRQILPLVAANSFVIPHPVPPNEAPQNEGLPATKKLSLPLTIGFLGLATPQKGFDDFLALAADARWRCGDKVSFDLIGRLPPDTDKSAAQAVLPDGQFDQRLPRDDYIKRLQQCDLIFVCLDEAHYGYSASGVLLDAIAWQKPLLCGGPLIARLATESDAQIGYLCDPAGAASVLDELADILDDACYDSMVENLRRLGSHRTIERTAHTLRAEFDRRFPDQQVARST